MAILASDPNLEQDKDEKEPQQDAGAPVSVSGAASEGDGSAGGAGPAGAGKPGAPAPTSSGRFQNLQKYLSANSGYNANQDPNKAGLAGQMTGDLEKQGNQYEQAASSEAQRVQSQAQEAGKPFEQTQTQSYLSQAFQDPTKVANDPNAYAQWQQYYGGTYQAPQGYDASGALQQNVQKFAGTTAQAQTEPGRMAMLQQLYGKPGYSAGQQSLDQLFLQSQPGSLSNLQKQSGKLAGQLQGAYTGGQSSAQGYLDDLKDSAGQASIATQTGLTGNIANEQVALTKRASDLGISRTADVNGLMSRMTSGTLTPADYASLASAGGGTSFTPSTALYGANPNSFITPSSVPMTVANVATPADQAKFQALARMSDQPVGSALGMYANPSAAPASYAVNPSLMSGAVTDAKTGYNTALQGLLSQMEQQQLYAGMGNKTPAQIQADIAGNQGAATFVPMLNNALSYYQVLAASPGAGYHGDVSGYVPAVQNAIQSLQAIMAKYNINPTTGLANTLQSSVAPSSDGNVAGNLTGSTIAPGQI